MKNQMIVSKFLFVGGLESAYIPLKKCGFDPVSASISAAGNVLNTAMTNDANAAMQERVNQTNMQIARENNALSQTLFEKGNAFNAAQAQLNRDFQVEREKYANNYNSFAAIKSRMLAAGINPLIAMQGNGVAANPSSGATASSSGLPSLSTPNLQASQAMPVDLSNLSNLSDSYLKAAEARKTNFESESQQFNNDVQLIRFGVEMAKAISEIQSMYDKHLIDKAEFDRRMEDLSVLQQTHDERVRNAKLQNEDLEEHKKNLIRQTQAIGEQQEIDKEKNEIARSKVEVDRIIANSTASVNAAQREYLVTQMNVLSQQDWRNEQSHVMDMNLKKLEEVRKEMENKGINATLQAQIMFTAMDLEHEQLKDASLINKMAERAFGLGFRDLGAALKNLVKPGT